jgi:anti-anti-sigma regulatory factor
MADSKSVGLFLLLPAPLNPIGAFDAETFKASFRDVLAANADAKFIGVDLTGIDFVYSDAYNAFMQFHQELSKRNGTFAVLADKESLAKSLRKVGLERFIRIFMSADEMAAYAPVSETPVAPAAVEAPVASQPAPAPASVPVSEPAPEAPVVPQPQPPEPKILDSNPLVDEAPSSKGTLIAVVVLLLIAAAVVSYLVL